jgi:hypothetical protein
MVHPVLNVIAPVLHVKLLEQLVQITFVTLPRQIVFVQPPLLPAMVANQLISQHLVPTLAQPVELTVTNAQLQMLVQSVTQHIGQIKEHAKIVDLCVFYVPLPIHV